MIRDHIAELIAQEKETGMIYACPECGRRALVSCWHGDEVRSNLMDRLTAADLLVVTIQDEEVLLGELRDMLDGILPHLNHPLPETRP